MNTWTAYHLFLTPLSPVHVGIGLDYEPTTYVIEGETLHEFDVGTLADMLSANDRDELARIVSGRPDDTMLRAIQKFFYDRRYQLAAQAQHRVPVQTGIATLYHQRVGHIAQQESRGQRSMNQLAISRTARSPMTMQPLLPGSSQKGAIRTALLDLVNNGAPSQEQRGLHEFFQARLFRYVERRDDGRMKTVLERDPLRLIHVADTTWQGHPELPPTEVLFAVNKPKTAEGAAGQPRSTRADSGQSQMLECISAWRYRAFVGQLTIHSLKSLGQLSRPGQVPDEDLRFDMPRVAEACNRFYRPILERELTLLRNHGWVDRDWDHAITAIMNLEALKHNTAFLLRLGRHSGAESVTLNGVRKILIRGGRRRPDRTASEATTIWLAANDRGQTTGFVPFGWALVEYAPLGQGPPADLSPLKQSCERRLTLARRWVEKLRALEADWRRKGLAVPSRRGRRPPTAAATLHCPWVDDKLAELCSKPGIKPDQALRSLALAEAVRAIDDSALRAQAVADIKARWEAKGWWDAPLGTSGKAAKQIYHELLESPS